MHRRKRKGNCLARLKCRIGKIRAHIQSDSSLEMRLKGKKKSPSAGSKNSHCFLSDCYTYRQLQTKEAGVVGYLYFFNTQNLHHFFLVFIHLLFRRTAIASSQVLILNILETAGQGSTWREAIAVRSRKPILIHILIFTFVCKFQFSWFSEFPLLPLRQQQAAATEAGGGKLRSHLWSSITNIVTTVMLSSILIERPIFLASQLVSIPTMRIHFSSNILQHFVALLRIPIVNVSGFLAFKVFSNHSERRLKMGFVP